MPRGIWEGLPPVKPLVVHDACRSQSPTGGIGCMPGGCSQCRHIINRTLTLCTACAEKLNCCQVCGLALAESDNQTGMPLKPFPVTHARCAKIPLPVNTRAGRCPCGKSVSSNAIKLCDSCSQLSGCCNRCGKRVRVTKAATADPTDKPMQVAKPRSRRRRSA